MSNSKRLKQKGTSNHVEISVPFAREVRNISVDSRIFAVDGTSVVGERKLSFVDGSGGLILLSMSQNVQNIVDHGSRKGSGFLEETEVNFTHFWISGMVRNSPEHGSRKDSDVIQGERSEFHSLSIEGTFRIISTIDLEKTESVEGREGNLSHFDRQVFADH